MMERSYFFHDSRARENRKLQWLVENHGMEGYGIYWWLIEILSSQNKYRGEMRLLGKYASEIGVAREKVLSIVIDFDLFIVKNGFFYSLGLCRRIKIYNKRNNHIRSLIKESTIPEKKIAPKMNNTDFDESLTVNIIIDLINIQKD